MRWLTVVQIHLWEEIEELLAIVSEQSAFDTGSMQRDLVHIHMINQVAAFMAARALEEGPRPPPHLFPDIPNDPLLPPEGSPEENPEDVLL